MAGTNARRPAGPAPGRPVRGSDTGRPIMALLDLLGRRWALRVLWELRSTPAPTFRDLQERCGGMSSSVLADRLAELTEARIVQRTGAGYGLTREGRELLKSVVAMEKWATRWADPAAAPPETGGPVGGVLPH